MNHSPILGVSRDGWEKGRTGNESCHEPNHPRAVRKRSVGFVPRPTQRLSRQGGQAPYILYQLEAWTTTSGSQSPFPDSQSVPLRREGLSAMDSTWVQLYDPLGSAWLSTLAAAVPLLLLLGLLLLGASAPRAALSGLLAAFAVAVFVYQMPCRLAIAAAAYGACFGLMPIGWIVLAAVFLYHLTVRSGQFEIVKRSVAAISPDRRIQALLIAFSFGTFLEGCAGFGTPVAICSALLIGLGFRPLYAAGIALLANTAPVAFGSLGIPIITLAKTAYPDLAAETSQMALSQMAGRQLAIFSILIPFWLVVAMGGWKSVKGCWPAILVSGGSFSIIEFLVSNFHGPKLVGVSQGLGSLVALTVFLRFWQPREIWRFPDEPAGEVATIGPPPTRREIAYAWTPWIMLSVILALWSSPWWNKAIEGRHEELDEGRVTVSRCVIPWWPCHGKRERFRSNAAAGNCSGLTLPIISRVSLAVPGLDRQIYRNAPVVPVPEGSDRRGQARDGRVRSQLALRSGHQHLRGRHILGLVATDRGGRLHAAIR